MRISVILPHRNDAHTIGAQLEALSRQTWGEEWEVIVCDNGSTDGTREVVERYADRLPNLRLVDASAKTGVGYARNVGAQLARGEYLAFCDADDEVGEGWLAALGEALCTHEFVACRVEIDKLNPGWIRESLETPSQTELPRIWYPPYLPHAGGGCIAIRRELHERVGGFDESMPRLQDTDYCFRVQLAGPELTFVPDAVLHYRHRDSIPTIYRQARIRAESNARLQRMYADRRPDGFSDWKWPLIGWRSLLRATARVHRKGGAARFAWLLGWQVGRLHGSFKYRVRAI